MLKQNWRFISRIERLGDYFIICFSFFAAYYGRGSLLYWDELLGWNIPFTGPELAPLKDYFIVLIISLVAYTATLNFMGAYSSMRLSSSWQLLRISIVSSAIVFVVLAAALFLLKIDLSRSFIALFCLLVGLLLTGERYLVLKVLRFWRRRGRNFRNIIICGIGEQAVRLTAELLKRPELGLRVRAFANLSPEIESSNLNTLKKSLRAIGFSTSFRVIQGLAALEEAIKDYAIDEVIFTDVVQVLPEVEEMVLACSEQGIRTTMVADLFSVGIVKSGISYFGELPLVHFHTPPGDDWALSVKRFLDLILSSIFLVLTAPLFFVIAVAIKLTSPGPVLYRQKRIGLNGRIFPLYKFRSMYQDAESERAKLLVHNEMSGPVFKMRNDPRVTPLGRFLRRYSLDELPQLWNVFRGDMSLVGPRPPIPGEVSLYERKDRRRLSMRPGITCTWQVSGRNEIRDFESWVKLDLEYIDNWSLSRDLILLLRTIPAVLSGSGAR